MQDDTIQPFHSIKQPLYVVVGLVTEKKGTHRIKAPFFWW